MTVAYREPPKGRITDLVIDSTGLKIFGEGEWKVRKHGTEKRRVWRKLHLAVDPVTHDIVAAEVCWKMSMMPRCCRPCSPFAAQTCTYEAYDSKASNQLILRKVATACIPPRKNAGLWEEGHPRNEAVLVIRKEGLPHWKKISGYHRRSLAGRDDNVSVQAVAAGKISLRNYNGQVGEVMAYVSVINKLNTLGLPVRKPRV
ncbi:IS5 family transposase [Aeromonas veronii]|uniref:IS5 family transposase n=1 Tax=Aeromonas veronii TaxID=654 RepID=UPI003D20DAA7